MLHFIKATLITCLPNLSRQSPKLSGLLNIYCRHKNSLKINDIRQVFIKNDYSVQNSMQRAGENAKILRKKKASPVTLKCHGRWGNTHDTGRSIHHLETKATIKIL